MNNREIYFLISRNGQIFRIEDLKEFKERDVISFLKSNFVSFRKRKEADGPIRVFLEITNKCNLHCVFCYNRNNNITRNLSLSSFKNILNKLTSSTLEIIITGGEPLLNPRFDDFIELASKKNISIEINTNGFLNQKVAEFYHTLKGVVCVQL
ncbi:MAG: radical SAM protein [archaeon]